MLHTGYFAKINQYAEAGMEAVSISLWPPKWYRGQRYSQLAPTKDILRDYQNGAICETVYEDRYRREVLSKLDPAQVAQDLDGKILCCFERTGEFCHRYIVAEWLRENGFSCSEYIV